MGFLKDIRNLQEQADAITRGAPPHAATATPQAEDPVAADAPPGEPPRRDPDLPARGEGPGPRHSGRPDGADDRMSA